MLSNSTAAINTSPTVGTALPFNTTTQSSPAGSASVSTAAFASWATTSHGLVDILKINDAAGNTLVRMKHDGTVEWPKGVQVNEAAKAFAITLTTCALDKVGITENVKKSMRDSVFNDLIDIARQKGSLSVDDLTYLLSASKIVEKLKG